VTLRRLRQEEVTPAVTAEAKRIIKLHVTSPFGTKVPFEADGRQYIAVIEEHYHEPGGPLRPWGKHHGVSVFVEDQEEKTMETIRKGSKGLAVTRWQTFLRGLEFPIVADGDFGQKTHDATAEFQSDHLLKADGIVGNATYSIAMGMGFAMVEDEPFPPKPSLVSLGQAGREKLFGKFPYVPAPTDTNAEAIRITDDWPRENIVTVEIPQLQGIKGAPANCRVQVHRLVAPKLQELFAEWEKAGLLRHLISWGGSWVPRFVRGSKSTLSPHAHGSAFDINAAQNGLGKVPAFPGVRGSVRELVPIANRLGWYWGGHFSRPDGMHFELVELDAHADTDPAPAMMEGPN